MEYVKSQKSVLTMIAVCTSLVFFPGVVKDFSGSRLLLLKYGIFILGGLCGIGIQISLNEFTSAREKRMFLLSALGIVLFLGISFNLISL